MSTTTTTTASAAIAKATDAGSLKWNLEMAAATGAKDVPDIVAELLPLVPGMAPKLLIASKSPWGTILGTIIGGAVAHYGVACTAAVTTACWSQDTINYVTGAGVLIGTAVGAYVMRYVTKAPISGVVSAG